MSMLDHALAYAARGWPCFPVHTPTDRGCSCRDASCSSVGKHPRTSRGMNDASTDPEVVRAWWTRWPDANIGLRTGVAFDVIDIDALAGCDALDDLAPDAEPIIGPIVLTGKGCHIYVAITGLGNRTKLVTQVDYRGAGGYVIAPPSLHSSGVSYSWSTLGPDTQLVKLPGWLRAVITAPASPAPLTGERGAAPTDRYGAAALERELGRLVAARDGERNNALNCAAFALGQLVGGGVLDAAHVAGELLHVARRVGLGDVEAERTIASGMRAGIAQPRGVPA